MFTYLRIWLHISVFGYIFTYLVTYLRICLHISVFGYIFTYMFTYFRIWLHIYVFGYIFPYLVTYLRIWLHILLWATHVCCVYVSYTHVNIHHILSLRDSYALCCLHTGTFVFVLLQEFILYYICI